MSARSLRVSSELLSRRRYDFGVKDSRGRRIGYRVAAFRRVFEPVAESATSWWTIEPGVWFVAVTHQLRNGMEYGPLPNELMARSEEELEKLIEKRIRGAAKRVGSHPAAITLTEHSRDRLTVGEWA
jgi:hypothetical protein